MKLKWKIKVELEEDDYRFLMFLKSLGNASKLFCKALEDYDAWSGSLTLGDILGKNESQSSVETSFVVTVDGLKYRKAFETIKNVDRKMSRLLFKAVLQYLKNMSIQKLINHSNTSYNKSTPLDEHKRIEAEEKSDIPVIDISSLFNK